MYGVFSPVSSEEQQYEEPSSPLDFDEKADRILVMRSFSSSDDSPPSSVSPQPPTPSLLSIKSEEVIKEADSTSHCPQSTTTSNVTQENSSSSSGKDVSTSGLTAPYSRSASTSLSSVLGTLCQPIDLASTVTSYQHHHQSGDSLSVDCTSEFDVNEAAKRLSMATSDPLDQTTSGEDKTTKKKSSKEISDSAVRFHANYQRHPKPPYPYTGMVIHAIYSAPEKCLTLSGVNHKLEEMFDFFKGSYKGWKDSVRHNLSHNACFVKGGRSVNPDSKGNLWHVDISKAPMNCFKLQDTPVARQGNWAQDLHVQLGVPEIHVPSKKRTVLAIADTRELSCDVNRDQNETSSVYSDEVFSSSSPESDFSYQAPLSITPISTVSEEYPSAPYNESLTETREPALFSDTSFEDQAAGPIKTGKISRQSRRYNPAWNKTNKDDLMKSIARKAAKKTSLLLDDTATQNLSPLYQSQHYLPTQAYPHLQCSPQFYQQQQYIPEPSLYHQPFNRVSGYDHSSQLQPPLYQSAYPWLPTYDSQQQYYPGYQYFPGQPGEYSQYSHPFSSWNHASYQEPYFQQTTDDLATAMKVFYQQQGPVDLSYSEEPKQDAPKDSLHIKDDDEV
ncbi:forkhead box protein H1-like [Saccostrea echinata]|uniref:forkhead box protein H1-like n=1 Tax=Saccostrea echinata TaxID=191078 RepID=UPI002A83D2AD|nr:forkhead box protein H1-like [Saccostrea echinata]